MLKDNLMTLDCGGKKATIKTFGNFDQMKDVALLCSNESKDLFVTPKEVSNKPLKDFIEDLKKSSKFVKGGKYISKGGNTTLLLQTEKDNLMFQPSRALSEELKSKDLPQILDNTEIFYGAYVSLSDLNDGLITPMKCNNETGEWLPSTEPVKITPRAELIGTLDNEQLNNLQEL